MSNANKIKKLGFGVVQSSLKEVSAKRLRNKAVHYLGQYASTERKLEQILVNFVKKKWPKISIDDAINHIEETVKWCREYGFVNDAEYAIMKIRSGRAKGYSTKQIKKRLVLAGLTEKVISCAFNETENSIQAEFEAALKMAKKKRIGPYAKSPIMDHENQIRQMARLARAGFSYEVCKNVFDYSEESEAN